MFPIGDDNVKGGAYPIFSYIFIALNIVVFIATAAKLQEAVNVYGANPCLVSRGENLLSIFTSMFLHGGLAHLGGNMLFLWIFGDNVESTIGNLRYFLFYVIGGVVAALTHLAVASGGGCVPMVGASGAIAAIMGAYFVMFPKSRIKIFAIITVFFLPAYVFLGIWIAQQVLSGFTELRVPGQPGGVAFWAHIGGFLYGVLCGLYFRNNYPKIKETVGNTNDGHNIEYHTVDTPAQRYNNWRQLR